MKQAFRLSFVTLLFVCLCAAFAAAQTPTPTPTPTASPAPDPLFTQLTACHTPAYAGGISGAPTE